MLEIVVGGATFEARLEEGAAPGTVAAFRRLLPLESKLIHARWSGEACWIPFGALDVGVGSENATAYPEFRPTTRAGYSSSCLPSLDHLLTIFVQRGGQPATFSPRVA